MHTAVEHSPRKQPMRRKEKTSLLPVLFLLTMVVFVVGSTLLAVVYMIEPDEEDISPAPLE